MADVILSQKNQGPQGIASTVEEIDHFAIGDIDWNRYVHKIGSAAIYCCPQLVHAIAAGLRQKPFLIRAKCGPDTVGLLPLIYVRSNLFGRFLVSLPYADWAGVVTERGDVARLLIDRAIGLADELDVRYLELRNQRRIEHKYLVDGGTNKVQMQIVLAPGISEVWKNLKSEVRTQIRKAKKRNLVVEWGGAECLEEFYDIFARNMRELGTPVFSIQLFQNFLANAPHNVEFCVTRLNGRAIAGCMAIHFQGVTEIPSACSLREYRSTAANSLMYWNAIERAVARGQTVFDFGRSTINSNTYTFKKKWGTSPKPTAWQYYLRKGGTDDMRPGNKRYQLAIAMWKRLPISVTRFLGPMIVRGIP